MRRDSALALAAGRVEVRVWGGTVSRSPRFPISDFKLPGIGAGTPIAGSAKIGTQGVPDFRMEPEEGTAELSCEPGGNPTRIDDEKPDGTGDVETPDSVVVGETEHWQVHASSPLPCAAVRRLKRDSRPLNEFPFLSDLARLVVESSEVRERSCYGGCCQSRCLTYASLCSG